MINIGTISITEMLLVGSAIGNVYLYFSKSKIRELDYLHEQLDNLKEIYSSNQKALEESLKNKEIEIENLKKDNASIKAELEKYRLCNEASKKEIERLSRAYTKQISSICKRQPCENRLNATLEDIDINKTK